MNWKRENREYKKKLCLRQSRRHRYAQEPPGGDTWQGYAYGKAVGIDLTYADGFAVGISLPRVAS